MKRAAYWGLALGFAAGFLAVLLFHQPTGGTLRALGLSSTAPYQMQPVKPFGVPRVLSLAFWGGVWGIVFAILRPYLPGRPAAFLIAGALFGALVPTAFSWFFLGGWPPSSYWRGLLVNGAWGLGTAFFLLAFDRLSRR